MSGLAKDHIQHGIDVLTGDSTKSATGSYSGYNGYSGGYKGYSSSSGSSNVGGASQQLRSAQDVADFIHAHYNDLGDYFRNVFTRWEYTADPKSKRDLLDTTAHYLASSYSTAVDSNVINQYFENIKQRQQNKRAK